MRAVLATSSERQRPPVLRGMEGVRSYWDSSHDYFSARIMPGEFYVTENEEIITTVLGSCIAVCIRDTKLAIGGMNHFMLPDAGPSTSASGGGINSAQYGVHAMEVLINTILANGGDRNRLEVKIFGGATVLRSRTSVGETNINFVRTYLREEGMAINTENVGGTHPRKVIYFPFSGRTLMKKLPIDNREAAVESERQSSSLSKVVPGEIDLF